MSAPNLKEIEWAIQELEKEESSFPVYAKLANLYTVRNEMLGLSASQPQIAAYSEAAGPAAAGPAMESVPQYGDSEFLMAVEGKDPAKVWAIIDDLMDALQVVNRRAYDNVIRKLERI